MDHKWFVQNQDRVEGPFSSDEIKGKLNSAQLTPQHLIWGPGMGDWQRIHWWLGQGEKAASKSEVWHYALNGQAHGPVSHLVLVDQLKALPSLNDVQLWTSGMTEWAPLFEFHDLLTEIGVNKRQFPRAEIDGQVNVRSDSGSFTAPLLTISESGLGALFGQDDHLNPGQVINLEISSAAFKSPLSVRAEIRYFSEGVCGLRFINPSPEVRGQIVQYVRHQNEVRFKIKAA